MTDDGLYTAPPGTGIPTERDHAGNPVTLDPRGVTTWDYHGPREADQ